MANDFELEIDGQPFWGETEKRRIPVFFSIPDDKILETNGLPRICILIAGFGGCATANVFRKMRNKYADEYNLVMIQCDYFGHEFMDKKLGEECDNYYNMIKDRFSPEKIWNLCMNGVDFRIESKICSTENRKNFCEMGLFQALDCLRAVKSVMNLMDDIGMKYSPDVFAYGFSHGAYLAYVMNALFPDLLSGLIDNSAWLYPLYINQARLLCKIANIPNPSMDKYIKKDFAMIQNFHAKEFIDDLDVYDLRILYFQFKNKAQIISFHGTGDTLISIEDKKEFLEKINNVDLKVVDESETQGEIFKNTSHGLGADFLKLFEFVMESKDLKARSSNNKMWEGANEIFSTKYRYCCLLEDGLPTIKRFPLK